MPNINLAKQLETIERVAAKEWRKQHDDPLGQLSFNEYDYLKVIEASEQGIRLTDLAMQMQVTKPSASNMVKRLQTKGLLTQEVSTQDARSKLIRLTEFASRCLAQDNHVYQVIAKQMLDNLTTAEGEQLAQLLANSLTIANTNRSK